MKSLARSLAWLLATSAVGVDAAVVPWLYDVEVPVASQSERQRAARTGLRELLVRVTGMAELPANPEIQAALREPERYYGRFEFSMRSRPHVSAPADVDARAPEQMVVALHYEPATVLALLRRAALPVWGADRPTVLAWVAVEDDEGRRIVSAGQADGLVAAVRRRARQRGLEVALPVMDLADHAVTPATVWGRFWEAIDGASARYNPDLIVVGRVARRADGSWTSDWEARSAGATADRHEGGPSLVGWSASPPVENSRSELSGRPRSGRVSHDRSAAAPLAVAAGVDVVADALAERFAVGGRLDAIEVTIRGASTIAAYASVLDYLRSREYIERMEVKAVARDVLTLHLHSRSSIAQLEELLSMGGPLAALPVVDRRHRAGLLEFAWAGDR